MKRTISLVLTLAMLIGMFAGLTINASAATYTFKDVSSSHWAYNAVDWAVGKDITNGVGDNKFNPNADCTEVQILTMIYRYEGRPSYTNHTFANLPSSHWAYPAVCWAIDKKLVQNSEAPVYGMWAELMYFPKEGDLYGPDNNGNIDLNKKCTREMAVMYLYQLCKHNLLPYEQRAEITEFNDVPFDNLYRYVGCTAVYWAVENKITNGTGNGNFSPDAVCSRAMIVTLLHRMNSVRSDTDTPTTPGIGTTPTTPVTHTDGHHHFKLTKDVPATAVFPGPKIDKWGYKVYTCDCGEYFMIEQSHSNEYNEAVIKYAKETCDELNECGGYAAVYVLHSLREYVESKGAIYLSDMDGNDERFYPRSIADNSEHNLADFHGTPYYEERHDVPSSFYEHTSPETNICIHGYFSTGLAEMVFNAGVFVQYGTSTDWNYKTWKPGVESSNLSVEEKWQRLDGVICYYKSIIDDYLAEWNKYGYSNDEMLVYCDGSCVAFDNYDHWLTYANPHLENANIERFVETPTPY